MWTKPAQFPTSILVAAAALDPTNIPAQPVRWPTAEAVAGPRSPASAGWRDSPCATRGSAGPAADRPTAARPVAEVSSRPTQRAHATIPRGNMAICRPINDARRARGPILFVRVVPSRFSPTSPAETRADRLTYPRLRLLTSSLQNINECPAVRRGLPARRPEGVVVYCPCAQPAMAGAFLKKNCHIH